MPERVPAFPKALKPNEVYDELTDGSVWKIPEAEWKAKFASMESAKGSARYYAGQRNMKAKVLAYQGDLYVQFEPLETDRLQLAQRRATKRQGRLAGQG